MSEQTEQIGLITSEHRNVTGMRSISLGCLSEEQREEVRAIVREEIAANQQSRKADFDAQGAEKFFDGEGSWSR